VRKDYHWGPKGATTAPLPAKVVYRIVPNETTAANLLLTHAINIATIIGPDRSRLNKAKLFKRVLAASPNDFWFNENSGHPAANASIRRALVQALNLKQIGSVITAGRGVPVTSLTSQAFSPCAGNSVTGSVPSYNPSAASGPLSSHPSIKVLYTPAISSTTTAAMELLQQQLSAAGAKVTLSAATTTDISAALFGTGNWDLAFVPVTVATPSQLVGFVSGPTPPNGANFGGINNAAYSKLVASAVTKTGAAACKDWLSAESALMRNADVAPANVETTATFGSRATFALDVAGILPTSLRLTK
jgi:peptide/nickel transport system substrate-binding protein